MFGTTSWSTLRLRAEVAVAVISITRVSGHSND